MKPFNPQDIRWIDLGLPSGNLWAYADFQGTYSQEDAEKTFGPYLPSKTDVEELKRNCIIVKRDGVVLRGPSGNKIRFNYQQYGKTHATNTICDMFRVYTFMISDIHEKPQILIPETNYPKFKYQNFSVRLCKHPEKELLPKGTVVHSNDWGRYTEDVIILENGSAFCQLTFPRRENEDFQQERAWLHDLSVIPGARERGLATLLVEICKELTTKKGRSVLSLWVKPGSWQEEWYKRLGFVRDSGIQRKDGNSVYSLDLSKEQF